MVIDLSQPEVSPSCRKERNVKDGKLAGAYVLVGGKVNDRAPARWSFCYAKTQQPLTGGYHILHHYLQGAVLSIKIFRFERRIC